MATRPQLEKMKKAAARAEEDRKAHRELQNAKEAVKFQHDLSRGDTARLIASAEHSARWAKKAAIIAAVAAIISAATTIIVALLSTN